MSAGGTQRLGVAPLTALDLSVEEYVLAAGAAGYAEVGLRAAAVSDGDPAFPLEIDSPDFARLEAAVAEAGVRVLDLEVFSLRPGVGPEQWEPVLAVGERLGASYLNVVGDHPDPAAFERLVVELTRDARSVGMLPILEPIAYRPFDSYPWALQLAQRADCRVELDLLHFLRTGAEVQLVASAPEAFPILQLCDAPVRLEDRADRLRQITGSEDRTAWQVAESRGLRQPLGEGDAPLAQLLEVLPQDVHLSVEVPNAQLRGGLDAAAWLALQGRRAREALERAVA